MSLNPFKVGDCVIYNPTKRGHDLDVMNDSKDQLRRGQEYQIIRIEQEEYIVVEGYRHPGGGIHWTEFASASRPTP